MNLLLLNEAPNDEGLVTIEGRQLTHLRKILKSRVGDTLRAGQINGLCGEAEILAINKNRAILKASLHTPPPPAARASLILALPRPLMLKRILQSVTSFGVKQVLIVDSEQVEKSYWSSHDLDEQVIHEQLVLGLEQASDTALPDVTFYPKRNQFFSETLQNLPLPEKKLLADPGAIHPCPTGCSQHCVVAIGPEGGFTETELGCFTRAGFESVHLGQRILRTETATNAILGRLVAC